MTEPNSQNEKPKGERRYDPELLKKGLRCDLDQYEMLKRCSDKRDITEWNEWRKENMQVKIWLQGAQFESILLERAIFFCANLKEANLSFASLEHANFQCAHLECADLKSSHLEGAIFTSAFFQGADFSESIVDGSTIVWGCEVDRKTDFWGVSLDVAKIDPGTEQLLEYNVRRQNWEEWYKKGRWWQRILKRLFVWPFWLISDYGLRIWRIIVTFFGLAFGFGLVYWLCPSCVMVNGAIGDIRGLWHALYFSVVTMTTLGFGDIAANPDSWLGQTLLMVQVILGYVLLGALVTRFAVLFTAGGPAGKFADDIEQKKDDGKQNDKIP